jgi:hypothetical protein
VTAHRFHGDERRFEVMADFVAVRFPQARTAADVAGGQGMLARILRKRHNIDCDVVDPRGWVLRGVPARAEDYRAEMASYYDVVIGLHPDNALREVVNSAQVRPVVVVPCCNFWSTTTKLGRDQLLDAIEKHQAAYGTSERVILDFSGPHNRALVLRPASSASRRAHRADSAGASRAGMPTPPRTGFQVEVATTGRRGRAGPRPPAGSE